MGDGTPQCNASSRLESGRDLDVLRQPSWGSVQVNWPLHFSCDPVNTDGLCDHGRAWEEAEESSHALCPEKAFLLRVCPELGRPRDPSRPVLPLPRSCGSSCSVRVGRDALRLRCKTRMGMRTVFMGEVQRSRVGVLLCFR